jgi:UDP-glucose 4-epimerase
VHPKAIFVEGDLADRAAIDAALTQHRPDAVMLFASLCARLYSCR